MALDDRYANKFAPLDSTSIYPKPGHQLFYTPMTGEMKCPRLYLCLTHAPTRSIIIWSTSYHHMIIFVHRSWLHLLFTIAFVHRHQVLLKLHRHAVHCSKASDLPFTLATGPSSQVMSWSSPPWSHDSMSCYMCNELLHHHVCEVCNISEPFPPPSHMLLTYMYLWTNHLCISHKHN